MILFSPRRMLRPVCCILLTVIGLMLPHPLPAADPQEEFDPNVPLLVINVASVERLLGQAVTTFESAGRPELSEFLGGGLAKVNDLRGLNRRQPLGLLLYLNGVFPEYVVYAPLKNVDDLLKTISSQGSFKTRKIDETRYEIETGDRRLTVKVEKDYAFIASSPLILERQFGATMTQALRLSRGYDLAFHLNMKGVAPSTRDLFLGALRGRAENDLQRRDRETASAHAVRRAIGKRNIDLVDHLVTQGQEVTLGWSISEPDRVAGLELTILAMPDSDFAVDLNEFKGARSYFAGLIDPQNPLTGSLSWRLSKSARRMFLEIFQALEPRLQAALADETEPSPVPSLLDSLRATTERGHLDALVQFVGAPPEPFALVGGIRVAESEKLAEALDRCLAHWQKSPAFTEVRKNVVVHKGVRLHRLTPAEGSPNRTRLFGSDFHIYLGVSPSAAWIGLGGEKALREMQRLLDKVAVPATAPAESLPLQWIVNLSPWMDFLDPERKPAGLAATARAAFAQGDDQVRLQARPLDGGIQFRLQLEEGFLRLIGRLVAARLDKVLAIPAPEGEAQPAPESPGKKAPDPKP